MSLNNASHKAIDRSLVMCPEDVYLHLHHHNHCWKCLASMNVSGIQLKIIFYNQNVSH